MTVLKLVNLRWQWNLTIGIATSLYYSKPPLAYLSSSFIWSIVQISSSGARIHRHRHRGGSSEMRRARASLELAMLACPG